MNGRQSAIKKYNHLKQPDILAEWRKEMKNMFIKGMGALMAAVLVMGVLVTQTNIAAAKNKAFANRCCSPQEKSYMKDGSFAVEPWFTYGIDNDYLNGKGSTVRQGTIIRATLGLPSKASVKSVSVKSSNRKVLKADKKKGTFTAVKMGTATISYKVVWSTSAKIYKTRNNKNMKTTKKGSTYTSTAKVKVKVVCRTHKYGKWVIKRAASCENEGVKQKRCSKCGEKRTDTISETGHKYDSITHKCTVCGQDDPDYEEEE